MFGLALEDACDITDGPEDFPAVFKAVEAEVDEEIAVGEGLDFFACDRLTTEYWMSLLIEGLLGLRSRVLYLEKLHLRACFFALV